jgi:uncharacterized membrane protein YjgN (DUF898 family)
MQSLINLFLSIKSLGLTNGWAYWKINRYYSSRPKEYAEFLFEAKKRAILTKDEALMGWIDLCQKHLDEWNNSRKLKP